jgi:hypothetical protein
MVLYATTKLTTRSGAKIFVVKQAYNNYPSIIFHFTSLYVHAAHNDPWAAYLSDRIKVPYHRRNGDDAPTLRL